MAQKRGCTIMTYVPRNVDPNPRLLPLGVLVTRMPLTQPSYNHSLIPLIEKLIRRETMSLAGYRVRFQKGA